MSTFGERLRKERVRIGLSQDEMALAGQVHRQSQSNYERDSRRPDSAYLEAVAAHGVDVLYVVTGERQVDHPDILTRLKLLSDAWQVLEEHYQRTGRSPTPEKKRQAAEALYQLSVERGGLQGNQDMVAILASMAA